MFTGGSLLFGSTGRPDLLGPTTPTPGAPPVRLGAPARRRAARCRAGAAHPRVRQLLLGHPVRGARLDHRAGEGRQPGPDPGRAGVRGGVAGRAGRLPGVLRPDGPGQRRRPGRPGPDRARSRRTRPQLRARLEAGEWLVDLRTRTAFAAGHVPGTLNFGIDGSFATYLGWLIPWGTPLTLLGESPEQVAEAQRELVRIGIDRPAAAATGTPQEWTDGAAGPVRAGHVRRPGPGPPPPHRDRPGCAAHAGVGRSRTSRARCTSRCTSCLGAPGRGPGRRGLGALRRRLPRLDRRVDPRRARPLGRGGGRLLRRARRSRRPSLAAAESVSAGAVS